MKAVKRILGIGLFILVLSRAESQIPLQISPDSISTSVALGNTFSFSASVKNDSTLAFFGRVGFNYSINGTPYSASDNVSGVEFDTAFAAILPGDTIVKNIVVHVSPPKFSSGPSVVVIWPKAGSGSSAYAKNALVLYINVTSALELTNIEDNRIGLYVLSNSIWIEKESEIELKRVRIFDVQGKMLKEQAPPSNQIPLPPISTGVYFAEIIYNQNKRKVISFHY